MRRRARRPQRDGGRSSDVLSRCCRSARDANSIIEQQLDERPRRHSHSRGITMEVLRRDLKLLIDDFGENPALAGPVHDYFRLLQDYRLRRGHDTFVIHSRGGYVAF